MSVSSGTAAKKRSVVRWLVWLAVGAFFVYFGVICAGIVRVSRMDDARPADAIVVFGAAQYSGHPSPVFRARLDHAYDLFQRRLAPVIITTGGQGGDPKFSEGGVGHDYLLARGHVVRHIMPDGKLQLHTLTPGAAIENGELFYPGNLDSAEEKNLFD